MVKDKSSNTHANKDEILKCWQQHFEAHLNTKFPHEPEAMLEIPPLPPDAETIGEITAEEIKKGDREYEKPKSPRNRCRNR